MLNLGQEPMNMNQSPTKSTSAFYGALFMVLAGIAFAIVNVNTQWVTSKLGFKSTSDAFWQYFIALLFSLPFLWRHGAASLKTSHPGNHVIRVIFAALGVQAFVASLANGVPIWQVIALVMTSPFFVILGAKLFLGERVGIERWLAALVAFVGAMVILQPWSTGFTLYSLYPVVAAIFWGAASLLTKKLTKDEPAESITVWLLLLLTPVNGALSAANGFEMPSGAIWGWLIFSGLLMFAAQYLLTLAYSKADAAYVQPFDDLKLVANVIAGFLAFGYAPEGWLWIGIAMILAASLYLLLNEMSKEKQTLGMAGAMLRN
jgi:drug/metabolite transporter (DMT)-like permease